MNEELSSPYFRRSEFACRCGECGQDHVDAKLLEVLNTIRSHFGNLIIITSGNRCRPYNAKIGGSPYSQHLYGRAADITMPDQMLETVHNYVLKLMDGWGGVGFYPNQNFLHLDTKSGGARRWTG